ncbi:MAG: iron transport system permease component [Phycisphaerales bacterium]|nr:iron transport system permease component [Phycisphaerales bacterium]
MSTLATISDILPPILTATSMAVACAMLSVFVVSRRWAFIGEGISHSGFGGAGSVWLLALVFPSLRGEAYDWTPYAGVVVFCLLTALAIGYFTRTGRVNSDAAIGIFLVASLAWGLLGQQIYRKVTGKDPVGFDTFLFGQMNVSPQFAIGAMLLCGAVCAVVMLLTKEIVAYCFDPVTAEASGVRVGFVHYLLMVLVSLTIVVGVRLAGNVLVTALLVLPGASALLLCRGLRQAVIASLAIALAGTLGGVAVHFKWLFIPTGPAIVLLLFGEFVGAYGWARVTRR